MIVSLESGASENFTNSVQPKKESVKLLPKFGNLAWFGVLKPYQIVKISTSKGGPLGIEFMIYGFITGIQG
jgi:hypothetical protein